MGPISGEINYKLSEWRTHHPIALAEILRFRYLHSYLKTDKDQGACIPVSVHTTITPGAHDGRRPGGVRGPSALRASMTLYVYSLLFAARRSMRRRRNTCVMCAAACGGGTWTSDDVDRSKTAVTAFVRAAGNYHGCRDSE